jgi:hypothetical protein
MRTSNLFRFSAAGSKWSLAAALEGFLVVASLAIVIAFIAELSGPAQSMDTHAHIAARPCVTTVAGS